MSLNLNDPTLLEAYEDVRSDKSETNWAFFTLSSDKKDTLQVAGTGSSGLIEFKDQLKDDTAGWGFIRMSMSNDEYSERIKFVLIPWCGDRVGVMRKAKLSIQITDVKKVIRSYHIEVPASSLSDIDDKDLITRLKKAGGANYDRQMSDY